MKENNSIDSNGMMKTGLYIHIPFCVKKCNYCAFLSYPEESDARMMYAKALINEIVTAGRRYSGTLDSVYFGGGTPTIMDVSHMSRIMTAIRSSFDLSPDAEITLEANPGTLGSKDRVKRGKLTAYKAMGINRLSMGVQSMDNDRLKLLGRIHTAEDVERDFRIARELGFANINLDLIFSVPGETTEEAISDAEKIIALRPEHISCYSLQLEEGTPFYEMADRGEISEVPDEEDRRTFHRISSLMREAGYEHYEISNFARMADADTGGGMPSEGSFAGSAGTAPGFGPDGNSLQVSPYRSRHNSKYWNMDDYIGIGLGASGFVNGIRYRNTADMTEYLESLSEVRIPAGGRIRMPVDEEHHNSGFDSISEAVFTGLRRREGITYEEAVMSYRRSAGDARSDSGLYADEFWRIFSDAREEAEHYARNGLLVIDSDGMRLTESGVDVSNTIMALFV